MIRNRRRRPSFPTLIPGPYTVKITLDGYEDYKTDVTISPDKPVDLGTVNLEAKAGNLSLTSHESEVTYTLTGPNGYTHDGAIPDKLENLAVGDYSLSVAQKDWKLPPVPISLRDHDNLTKDIKFPFAKVAITSTPPGATVRDGRTVLGTTRSPCRRSARRISISRSICRPTRFSGSMSTLLTTATSPSRWSLCRIRTSSRPVACPWSGFPTAAIGQPSILSGKVTSRKSPAITRASSAARTCRWKPFRGRARRHSSTSSTPTRAKAGKVPASFHYSLPTEVQWDQMNADADLSMAATSSITPLTSTQNVGYSSPNKYGLYDTLGNVWEWCLDDFDANGNHTLRGGTWLSLPDNFPNASARQGGPPKYADKFIGFRVVLVPNA